MPGHVKKTDGPDPCPNQWLYVSDELKVKLKSKPYDPKKSCWVPEKATGGYLEGLIENIEGEKATVKILSSGDVSIIYEQFSVLCHLTKKNVFFFLQSKVFKKDQVGQVNPPKFDCSDDMAGLTYLNDACGIPWLGTLIS